MDRCKTRLFEYKEINATRQGFQHVIDSIKSGLIHPLTYITRKVKHDDVKTESDKYLDSSNGIIKAMVEI